MFYLDGLTKTVPVESGRVGIVEEFGFCKALKTRTSKSAAQAMFSTNYPAFSSPLLSQRSVPTTLLLPDSLRLLAAPVPTHDQPLLSLTTAQLYHLPCQSWLALHTSATASHSA